MRRLGFANAADIHCEDQKALARQLLEHAKLHPFLFFSRFVHVHHRRISIRLIRHENPGGKVNAGLGDKLRLLDLIPLARGGDDVACFQRIVVSAELQCLRDFPIERGTVRLKLGATRGEFPRGRKSRLRLQDQ